MKVYSHKILLIFFILFSVALHATEKERIVNKSYKVNADTELKINNSFGTVNVESYSGDEIFIEVKIWAKGNSEKKVAKFIDSVEIDFVENNDNIEVETSNISNNGKVKKFKVDYSIKIPINNDLSIENNFGNIKIGNHKGVVRLNVSHGNIKALDIKNKNNNIDLQFGNADINKYGSGKIELQHSNLDVNSVLDLKLESEFSNTKINEIVRSVDAEVSHGSLNFESVNVNFESIKIEAEFSQVDLKMKDKTSYSIEYKGSFTSFEKPDNLKISNREKDYTSEKISGTVNGGGSMIDVKLSHSTLGID